MTQEDFRRVALSIAGASESAHMGHPDFRIREKIFATLGYPDQSWAMLKLTPEQQRGFVQSEPDAFVPVKGAWGVKGATNVRLSRAKEALVHEALIAASSNIPAAKRVKRKS